MTLDDNTLGTRAIGTTLLLRLTVQIMKLIMRLSPRRFPARRLKQLSLPPMEQLEAMCDFISTSIQVLLI